MTKMPRFQPGLDPPGFYCDLVDLVIESQVNGVIESRVNGHEQTDQETGPGHRSPTSGPANWSWAVLLGTQLMRPDSAQPLVGGFP